MNEKETEFYLKSLADNLEPKTHCCECTPGPHYERHNVHIQYPNCDCHPKKYVLRKNFSEDNTFLDLLNLEEE